MDSGGPSICVRNVGVYSCFRDEEDIMEAVIVVIIVAVLVIIGVALLARGHPSW